MDVLVIITLLVLGAFLLGQFVFAVRFVFVLLRHRRELLSDVQCPRAAVVLCLRGSDPFLPHCLSAIAAQDYPQFIVKVIVDDRDDPAWDVVDKMLHAHPACPMQVEPRTKRLESCSLKCSSLVQAVESLGDEYEFVAQLDADTVPHRSWLRELATALAEEDVGAVSGNRWYMPEHVSWPALIRSIWNGAAVVQMYWYRIAWGGTLAVKTKVIREAELVQKWSRAFCEDTMLFSNLRRLGWRVNFVPSLMMVNREDCDLHGFFHWVMRQLLTARLYHPGWPAVLVHGLGTTIALGMACLLAAVAAWKGEGQTAAWLVGSLVIYQISAALLLAPIEWAVRRIMVARGESTVPWTAALMIRQVLAMLATQIVYPLALASAAFVRRVTWRQAVYQIHGPWRIQLISETPYTATSCRQDSRVSL